jgi:hypothetical protein
MADDEPRTPSASDRYRRYRRYVDRLTIVVQPVEHPMYGQPDTEYVIEAPSGYWDAEWIEEQLVAVASTSSVGCGGHGSYTLDTKYSSTEWGASGAAIQFVLQTVAGAAIAEAVHILRDKLARTVEERGDPITEAEAIERAKWLVQRRYGVSSDSLTLQEITTISQGRAITTLLAADFTYTVTHTLTEGLVTCTEITRRRRADD